MTPNTKPHNKPAVTVIVCAYNAESTIQETVATLLAQTYYNLSVLVIDDGSTDSTADIIAKMANSDSRLRILRNESNRGTAYTRSRGLRESKSDLVLFFDSDDLALPDLVLKLVDAKLRDPQILGVGCYCYYFNGSEDLGLQCLGPTSREESLDIYKRNNLFFLAPPTLFDRRDAYAVGGYRLDLLANDKGIRYEDLSEDTDLWCRMSDMGSEGRYFLSISEPLFRYRKTKGSLSSRNLYLNQTKMRWVKDCLLRRRTGRSERSLAEFIQSRTWLEKLDDLRSDKAATYYKQAGFAFSDRKYITCATLLGLSAIFSPKLIRKKLKTQSLKTIRCRGKA